MTSGGPAVVAWIVSALLSHSVEEYVLAISGLNPAWDEMLCKLFHSVIDQILYRRVSCKAARS